MLRTEDLNGEAGAGLSDGVDGAAAVLAGVLLHQTADVQRHVAEVERRVEPRRRLQRLAVVEELDAQVRVVEGLDAALHVSHATLRQLSRTLRDTGGAHTSATNLQA